jgi:putative solute:sodium symporter small subunit
MLTWACNHHCRSAPRCADSRAPVTPARGPTLNRTSTVAFDRSAHWRSTLRRIAVLLAIWALVGPVMSILFVEQLNTVTIAGVPFGFWMGQQGSIYVFVILIFVNAWMADRLDRTARGEGSGTGDRDQKPGTRD